MVEHQLVSLLFGALRSILVSPPRLPFFSLTFGPNVKEKKGSLGGETRSIPTRYFNFYFLIIIKYLIVGIAVKMYGFWIFHTSKTTRFAENLTYVNALVLL